LWHCTNDTQPVLLVQVVRWVGERRVGSEAAG
jgi:hypothetical protein